MINVIPLFNKSTLSIFRFSLFFCIMTILLTPSGTTGSQNNQPDLSDYIVLYPGGSMNWTNGKITAMGNAAPKGKQAANIESAPGFARATANQKLIEILKQIPISPILNVGEYADKNDIILSGMEKTAWDAVVTRQLYTSALALELKIETSIYGGFLQLVLPEEIRQIPKISPLNDEKETSPDKKDGFTGLIIDAKGLKVSPVLTPGIISEQGQEVYSSVYISREFAVQNGVCKYTRSIERAFQDKRIGNKPLVISALRIKGDDKAIVISMADFHMLEKTRERHGFLAECRVVIIID